MLEYMIMDEIISFVDGVLTLRPAPGDGSPEVSWGDTFFYYAPDGVTSATPQPFAMVVTKNFSPRYRDTALPRSATAAG
ncbi:DUF6194 family protein [Streptosporangium amethystogenes]|uniref:DUF6194 family protein n=1 Tax=Streptosporangium amethystogenes TaxID=2002 RepID=UPI000B19659C|nr:DUF6194 family protein [Streptosporangium amethystogenes]